MAKLTSKYLKELKEMGDMPTRDMVSLSRGTVKELTKAYEFHKQQHHFLRHALKYSITNIESFLECMQRPDGTYDDEDQAEESLLALEQFRRVLEELRAL